MEIVRLARVVLELLLSLGQPLRTLLLQPLITITMLLFLYAGWHVRDEGSISAGLRVAFIDTRAYRAEHLRELESAVMQIQLQQTAQTDHLINQLLETLLHHAPTASRVRLDVIHNGVTGVTGTALLRYDVTNSIAAAGHAPGPLVTNQPLSDWNDILPALLGNKCKLSAVSESGNIALRARLEAIGAATVLACPVIDVQGRLLGGVFLLWDVRDTPPEGEDLDRLMEYAKYVGVQIASALDLRGPLPFPVGARDVE